MGRRLKLISDGTPEGTQLIDSKSGEPIEGVQSISFDISVNQKATMVIEIMTERFELLEISGTLHSDGKMADGGIFFKE